MRLGNALSQRRGQLGYGFRRRREFARRSGLAARTLARIEHAERDAYPAETIGLIEAIYHWRPGSIARVLAGDDPEPAEIMPADASAQESEDIPPIIRDNWGSIENALCVRIR